MVEGESLRKGCVLRPCEGIQGFVLGSHDGRIQRRYAGGGDSLFGKLLGLEGRKALELALETEKTAPIGIMEDLAIIFLSILTAQTISPHYYIACVLFNHTRNRAHFHQVGQAAKAVRCA